MEPLSPGTWWIQLARTKTLAEAYSAMLRYSGLENKIRLIPLQDGTGGVQFIIVARKGFPSQAAAGEELQRLPAAIATEAEVVASLNLGQSLFQLAGKQETIE